MCTDLLSKDKNWNYARGYPLDNSFPLVTTQFLVSNKSIKNFNFPFSFLCMDNHWMRGLEVFSPKIYLGSQNHGIFQDFEVELLQSHPGLCGDPCIFTGMGSR